jgi:phage tail sheath gpL-like
MTIPLAVNPSVLTPGLYLIVNLLAGAASPGTGTLRVLLLSPKASGGTLTADTEIRAGGGPASAALAFGTGALGHLVGKLIYGKAPLAQVDFGAPTAGSGSATTDVTASGSPAENIAVELDVMGREFEVAWNASETADTWKTRAIAEIQSRTSDLMVVPSDGGVGVVTLTSKVAGNVGNDVKVKAKLSAASGTADISPTSYTNLVGGTTDADFSTILALAAGREYHFILICTSNADYVATGASAGPEEVLAHINALNEGGNAKLQQAIFASTTTLAAAKTAAVARNDGVAEHVLVINGRSLPAEVAGRELGGRLAALNLDPNPNRIGEEMDGLYASGDVITDTPTEPEVEDALGSGVAICNYDAQGDLFIVRPVTTYSQDASGGADRRLVDVSIVDATYIMSRDVRSYLPQEFPNAKVQKDAAPGDDPPPAGVVEERDVKTSLITRLRFWQRRGVILGAALDEVIASGELVVEVNETDSGQVDILIPHKVVPLLSKFGVVVERRAS